MPGVIKIEGKIQNYQWGGTRFISELLSLRNAEGKPQAEYWLGAHKSAPSLTSTSKPLPEYIENNKLPALQFLMKVLDVKDMLSIQVHPSLEQAKQGLERENRQGIPPDAQHRNYKDGSDKPELAVALSEFWLLHGFKTEYETAASLAEYGFLKPLLQGLETNGLGKAFEMALNPNTPEVEEMHQALRTELSDKIFAKHDIKFWMQRWINSNPGIMNGILTLFFLNLVKMNKGEAIYQPPGLLHAYLEGQNIELMANSDNVLRAGLTPKHMDVPELLRICHLQPSDPAIFFIKPLKLASGELVFSTPFDQFELSALRSEHSGKFSWHSDSLEVLLCYEGEVEVCDDESSNSLSRGQSILIEPFTNVSISGKRFCIYRAINK